MAGGAAPRWLHKKGGGGCAKAPADLNTLPRKSLPGVGKFDLPSINIYARGASGNTPPLRVIKGPHTQFNWPSHVAVHEDRGEIFVWGPLMTRSGGVFPLAPRA